MNTIRAVLFLLVMGLLLIGTNGEVDAMRQRGLMDPGGTKKVAVEYKVTNESRDTCVYLFESEKDTTYTIKLENTGKEGTIGYILYDYREGSMAHPLIDEGKVTAEETMLKKLKLNGTVMIGLNREVKVRQRLNPRWWEALFLSDNELYSCGEGTFTIYKH